MGWWEADDWAGASHAGPLSNSKSSAHSRPRSLFTAIAQRTRNERAEAMPQGFADSS